MPVLISETEVKLEKSDLLRRIVLPRQVSADGYIVPPPRTPGLHLSGLLRYIAERSRISEYAKDAKEEEEIERGLCPLRWFVGIAWEETAASLYPDMIWQPGEVTDPVIMTPDGIGGKPVPKLINEGLPSVSFWNDRLLIHEFKMRRAKRWKDVRTFLAKWIWMKQGAGYCLGYGANYVCWHVLHLFEFPDPMYVKYLVRFDDGELADMRRMIDVNREAAIREGYAEL